jgi:hypothetical protein
MCKKGDKGDGGIKNSLTIIKKLEVNTNKLKFTHYAFSDINRMGLLFKEDLT